MSDCPCQCAETIDLLRAQMRCLTWQIESLTKQVAVLTERQREATDLEHIIRRVKFAPYVDTPHADDMPPAGEQPRPHLHVVQT